MQINGIVLAGSLVTARFQKLYAQITQKTKDLMNVVSGFTGPKYYDHVEEEQLREVLMSRYPFRFRGHSYTKVRTFESKFKEYIGSEYALAVTSGTAALNCAMAAMEVGPSDEVIIPACTWWSNYTTVIHAGALPVFADIDESLTIDPKDIERKITPRTKVITAVHLCGSACDMDAIMDIAARHKVMVLEDCAQSPGATYKGKKLGTIGHAGIFSFNIYKLMTSGEGGAFVTDDKNMLERAVRFHDMGVFHRGFDESVAFNKPPYTPGENYRMNEFTGAVLLAQLPKLDKMIGDLRRNKHSIMDSIKSIEGIQFRHYPDPEGETGSGIHILVKDKTTRDRYIKALKEYHIPVMPVSGSVLLPIQDAVVNKRTRHPNWPSFNNTAGESIMYGADSCRQTIAIYNRFIQINIGAKYTTTEINYIVESVRKVCAMLNTISD